MSNYSKYTLISQNNASKCSLKEIRYSNFLFEKIITFSNLDFFFEFFSIFRKFFEFFEKKKTFRKPNFFFEKIFFCRSHHEFLITTLFEIKEPCSLKLCLLKKIILTSLRNVIMYGSHRLNQLFFDVWCTNNLIVG